MWTKTTQVLKLVLTFMSMMLASEQYSSGNFRLGIY